LHLRILGFVYTSLEYPYILHRGVARIFQGVVTLCQSEGTHPRPPNPKSFSGDLIKGEKGYGDDNAFKYVKKYDVLF